MTNNKPEISHISPRKTVVVFFVIPQSCFVFRETPSKHLVYCRQGDSKYISGSSHTPACCLSKLRSSLEAGKKQLKVWLQYGGGVTEIFLDEPSGRVERLYTSFRVHLVLLWYPYGDSEMVRSGALYDEPMWNISQNGLRSFMNISFRSTIECIL